MKGTVPRRWLSVRVNMRRCAMLNVYFYNRRIKEAPSSDAQRYKIVSKKNLRGAGGFTKKTRNASVQTWSYIFYPMIITA